MLGGILFFGQDYLRHAEAITYTWTQTSWGGSRDPQLQPSSVNLTNWSSYASSSPTGVEASVSGLKLQQILTSYTQTDHSKLITGFNYNTPTQTNTTVVGIGSSAMVTLIHDNKQFGLMKQGPLGGASSALQGGVFTPNGKYLIVASQGREIGAYPVIDGELGTYKPFTSSSPIPTDIAEIDITSNGKWILVSSGGNSGYSVFAVRFDPETGEFLNPSWTSPGGTGLSQSLPASSIAVSRDGLWAVAGLRQPPYLYFFSLNQESPSNPFVGGFAPTGGVIGSDVFDVTFDFDHSHVAIAKNTTSIPSGGVAIFRFNGTSALTPITVPYVGGNSRSVVFVPPSSVSSRKFLVYQTNSAPGLGVVDYTTTPQLYVIPKSLESSEIASVEVSPDGKELYTHNSQTKAGSYRFNNDVSSNATPWVSTPNDAPLGAHMPFNTYGLTLSPDGNFVVVYGASGQVVRYVRPPLSYTKGTHTSSPISFGSPQTISAMTHTASAFSGATVSLRIRGGNSPTPDASWSSYFSESAVASLTAFGPVQYFQYEATFDAPPSVGQVSHASPVLHDINISYSRYPASGYVVSSMYKMSILAADKPALRSISWKEKISNTSSESVSFQLQSFQNFSSTVANSGWLGPDGTSNSSFSRIETAHCTTSAADASGFVVVTCSVPSDHKINKDEYPYIQYRVELKSVSQNATPIVSEVNVKYGINSAPSVSGITVSPVSSSGSHTIGYNVADLDNPVSMNVGVFYDIGLRLDSDPGPAGNSINIIVPGGGTLSGAYLPPDGMIAIDDEIIEYHNVSGTYISSLTRGATSATSLFKSIPASHTPGSIIWVRANDADNASQFGRIPAAITCPSGTCIGSGVSLGTRQLVWTPKDDIPGSFYLTDAKIRIIANDQEVVRNIGSGISSAFTLDTKPPKLSGYIDVQNAAILVPNQGYKIKGGSATLSLPSIDINNDNTSGNLMYFCGGTSCTNPPSGWFPSGGFAPAASYAWNVNTTPQEIHFAVIDSAGNISTQQTAAVISDTTPPPAPPSGSFKAQDISSSLGRPAVYVTWDPLVWSTQQDGFGRQDFKEYHIFRDNASCGAPQDGFCEIASIGTGQTTSFADESVADKITYNYRIQVEDDAGNVSHQVSDASIPKAQISVSLTGGPVIEPLIQNIRFVSQNSYTDPITFYWDTVQKDSPETPTAADSFVSYYKSSSPPADPVAAFDNAPTQGSAQQKSIGVVQPDGDCACHKVKLVGLEAGEKYFFQLRSTLGSKTATHVVDSTGYQMQAAPPQLIPVISDVTPADRAILSTPTSARITWNTKYPPTDALSGQPLNTDAFIEYGVSAALGTYTGNNESRPDHVVDIVGLQPNTTYYYQIHSKAGGQSGGEGVAPASGTYSFTTATMTEDKVPPTITNEGVTQRFGTSVTVEWDTDEQASSVTEYWETANASVHALVEDNPGDNTQTHHTTHVKNLIPDTQYTCRVISLDAANNRSQSGEFSCDTGPAEVLPEPVVSNIHNDAPGPNNVVIYWNTDNVISNSVVFYSEDSGFTGAQTRKNDSLVNGHEVTLVGLTPGKEYFYKVKSSTAGNQTSAESSTCSGSPCKFQTPLAAEAPPQIVPGSISVTPQEHSAVITWRTSKAASSLIQYGKGTTIVAGNELPTYDGGVFGDNDISTIDGGQAHSVTLPSNLIDGETYYFRVISYDSFRQLAQFPEGDPTSIDNPSDAIPSCSSDRYNCLNPSFDTIASALTQEAETKDPLSITNVLPLAVTNITAVVGWNTNRVADSCVIYGPSSGLGSNAPVDCDGRVDIPELKELTRTHAVTLKDLQSNTKYYFKVVSRNSVATQRVEEDNVGGFFTFTTTKGTEEGSIINVSACPGCVRPDASDVTPPILSEVAISDIGKNSAKVTWKTDEGASSIVQYGETSDYDGLAGTYTILMDHSVTLKDLTGGTDYVFVAVSYDALGNRGESDEISFKTLGTKADKPKSEDEEGEEEEGDEGSENNIKSDQKDSIEKILDILKGLSDEDASKVLQELGLQLVSPPKFVEGRPQVEVTQTSATISWTTDKDADSRVAYVIGVDYNEKKQDPYALTVGDTDNFTKNHEVTIANLEPGTLYHYQIRSRERAGRTAYAPDRTFRTAPIKPDIAKITVKDITEHSATFLWKTNVPTKTSVEYENQCAKDAQDCKKQKLTQGDSQLIKTHQFLLKDLISDTDYLVTIRSEDENGLQNISKPIKLRTGKDITPPELSQVRTKLSLSPGKEDAVQAVISWKTNEPADTQVFFAEGVKKDDLLKSGEKSPHQPDNTTNHVVVLNKLRPGTVYRFKAVSKDPAGNSNPAKEFKIITPRKEESVLELIIKNFEEAFGFLKGGQ